MNTHTRDLDELMAQAGWIRGLALQLVGDPHSADDLVQETWLAALTHPPERPVTRPWLGTVLRNFARQRVRTEASRDRREELHARSEELPSSEQLLERAELQRMLVESVMALDDPYRSTLLMHFYEGFSSAEIARRRGVSDSTVRSWVRRGLERLRERLDARHGNRAGWCSALVPLFEPRAATGLAWTPLAKVVTAVASLSAAAVVTAVVVAGSGQRGAARVPDPDGALPASARVAAATSPAAPLKDTQRDAALPTSRSNDERSPLAPGSLASAGGGDGDDEDAPLVAAAPVRGRVVDAQTGEPVPHFALYIYADPEDTELVTTDGAGHFESTRSWPAGVLQARFVDYEESGWRNQFHEWEHAGAGAEPVELHPELGPTFLLDFDMPAGLSRTDFVAAFGPSALGYSIRCEAHDPWRAAPVRAGSPAWVRFAPLAVANAGVGPRWSLEIVSHDGLHWGPTDVERKVGRDDGVHRIDLVDGASLFGQVLDETGQPIPDAMVSLRELREEDPLSIRGQAGAGGAYRFRAMRPGPHSLGAVAGGFEPMQAEVTLELLRATEVDVVLHRLPAAAPIEGVVRSATGTYADRVTIRAQTPAGTTAATRVEWISEAGTMVGRFRFDDVVELQPGQTGYLLYAQREDLFAWDGDHQRVAPGATGIEFVVHDDVPTFAFGFRVLDDATGAPLAGVPAIFGLGALLENPVWVEPVEFGGIVLPAVPVDAELYWSVRADGYAPAFGTIADLETEGGRRFARARLRPGWGARFHVSSIDGPIEGARLSFDGREYGLSDSRGLLDVSLPARPERLAVEAEGWELQPSSLVNEEGLFDDTYWNPVGLWMGRVE